MASITPPYVNEHFLAAIRRTLEEDIRKDLKAQLTPVAEQYVDAAVDAAVGLLRVKIETWVDMYADDRKIKIDVTHQGRTDDPQT